MLLVQVIYLILSSICQIALGYQLWTLVSKALSKIKLAPESDELLPLLAAPCYILGLLIHLSGILVLKSLGLHWLLACLLPLLPSCANRALIKRVVSSIKIKPSINFSLWFFMIFFLGLSLIQTNEGIQTIWANNYGDACFHLGMINSFAFGENFPPELQIFSGTLLSYPFFMNLWTASIWWINDSYYSLGLIWLIQWIICWCLVFHFLRGNINQLLPWVILFAGGTFAYLSDAIKDPTLAPAHSFIHKGYPWAPFLTTIWIPQRTTQLGLVAILAALFLFHSNTKKSSRRENKLILAGLILAFSVLAHAHFFLATVLYIGGSLLLRTFNKVEAKNFLRFAICLAPSLLFYPFIHSKTKIFSVMKQGWMTWSELPNDRLLNIIYNSFIMWANNAPVWLFALGLLWIIAKKTQRTNLLVILLLFIAGNVVNLAYWDWDQIKFFIALYVISISFWASLRSKKALAAQIFAVVLIVPGLFETSRVLKKVDTLTLYNKAELEQAEQIKKATEPTAVILAKPDHNSPITLTGRKLYSGYEGTLWSHGIKHEERSEKMKSLKNFASCKDEVCPDYLYWSEREKGYWKEGLPETVEKTELPFLYKIKP